MQQSSPPHPLTNRSLWAKTIGKEGGAVFLILLTLFGAYTFFWQGMRFFLVPSASMEPMLYPNDQIVTIKADQYRRGDIVVLRDTHEGGYIVKRLIAFGGETVNIEFGATHLNGKYLSEPYIFEPMQYGMDSPLTVPPGQVFLLGDNRNNSLDSGRTRETWPADAIVGKVIFRYYPYPRAGRIFSFPLASFAS